MARSPLSEVRINAIDGLAGGRTLFHVDLCLAALADPDPRVRDAAARTLATFDPDLALERVFDALVSGQPALIAGVRRALPGLRGVFELPTIHVLQSANATLGHRVAAAYCLGEMRSRAASAVLAEHAWSSEPYLAMFSARALVKLNDPNAADSFVALTHHALSEVRAAAVQGLAQTGGPVVVDTLERLVASPGVGPTMRAQAAWALGMVGLESSIPVLVEAMQAHPGVREAAGQALKNLTRLDFGDSARDWSAWYQEHRNAQDRVRGQPTGLPPILEIPDHIAEKLAPGFE